MDTCTAFLFKKLEEVVKNSETQHHTWNWK